MRGETGEKFMHYILLYKGSCAACSKVAEMVNDLTSTKLEARSADSAEVQGLISDGGLEAPKRPAMLMIGDGSVRIVAGWKMRLHLAGLLGWRQARAIVRLSAAEWRARLTRTAGSAVLSRRGVVGAGLASIAGIAIIPQSASASSRPGTEGPVMGIADRADVERALAVEPVQRAIRTWGPVQTSAHEITSGNEKVLVLVHGRGDIVTLVDNSANIHSSRTVLSMGEAPTKTPGIRFYTVNGAAIADITQSNQQVKVAAAHNNATPDISPIAVNCFIACIGANASAGCVLNCFSCVTGGAVGAIIDCPQCLLCAGPDAVKCARLCF
jgi:hypothetical protein